MLARILLILVSTILLLSQTVHAQGSDAGDTVPALNPNALGGITRQATESVTRDRIAAADTADVNRRWRIGSTALQQMIDITANVNEVLSVAQLEQTLGLGTNPWSDQHFRNWADRAENWGSTLGLAVAALGPLLDDDNRDQYLQIGIGSAGLMKLLGTLFGQQTGQNFEEKVAFVEFTRKAYDDLRARNVVAGSYVESNRALLQQMESFKAQYDTASTPERRREVVIQASSFLSQFDDVMTQIPALYQLYEETINRYCPNAIQQAQSSPNTMGGLECNTHRPGEPAFRLTGQTKDYMLLAARQLIDLRRNQAAANRLRQFSAELRGALLGRDVAPAQPGKKD